MSEASDWDEFLAKAEAEAMSKCANSAKQSAGSKAAWARKLAAGYKPPTGGNKGPRSKFYEVRSKAVK